MNQTVHHLIRCFVFVCASGVAVAQTPAPMTVSTAWLTQHSNDPDLVLLFTSGRPDQPRIPGAHYIDRTAFAVDTPTLGLELPPAAHLDSALEAVGVSDRSRIIVYAGDVRGTTNAARLYLTLTWAGLGDRTSMLDGGLQAWRAAGGAVTTDPTPPPTTRGTITLHPRTDIVVQAAWVKDRLGRPGSTVIDARPEAGFADAHLPGARHLLFSAVLDSAGFFRPAQELRVLFASTGAAPSDTVVAYCSVGQVASLTWFGARLAGYNARMYDGSFSEWSTLPGYPIDRR
jgi:thiosulfate/3-mercaptopyruvate sulfurtransferase